MAEPIFSFVIEGELLERWTTAQQKVLTLSDAKDTAQKARADLLTDPVAWSKSFQAKRHKDQSRFSSACSKVRGSLGIIQKVLRTFGFAINVTSSVVPAAKPAAFVIDAFSWLFESFAKVSNTFDAIETLFEQLSWRFKVIASAEIGHFTKEDDLQECVVNMFVCCLEFCQKAFEKVDSKPKLWFELLGGRDEAGSAMKKLEHAHEHLCYCISWKTLTRVGKLMQKVKDDERKEILDWMSSMEYSKMHRHVKNQVPQVNTFGRWLLESELFRRWRDTQNVNRIWYTGNPGAGKSVLASIIIDHLQKWAHEQSSVGRNTKVAYLYMSYTNPSDLDTLLGSILRQCHGSDKDFHPEIYRKFHEYRGDSNFDEPPSTDVIKFLLSQVSMTRNIFVVIDALDECPLSFRKNLIWAIEDIHPGIKILITSRILQQLEVFQKEYQTDKIEAHNDDMDEYIRHTIGESPNLISMSSYHDVIKTKVKQKSEKMFIIVRLHMEALANAATESELEDVLRTLPDTIHETYESALRRILSSPKGRDLARSTLGWVAYAQRILSMREIQHALAIEKRVDCTEKDVQPENEILSHCCGLIIKDIDDGVRFVHRSASEFFDRTRDSKFPNFNERITFACARYLSMPSLRQHLATNDYGYLQSTDTKDSPFPFIRYAGEFLHEHHRRVGDFQGADEELQLIRTLIWDDDVRSVYSQLLLRHTSYAKSSAVLGDEHHQRYSRKRQEEPLQPLHIAVYLGSQDLVDRLVREGVDLNTVDPYGQSALTIAISCGLDNIASALLNGGAEVDLSTKRGHRILLYAMERDNKDVVAGIIMTPMAHTLDEGFLKIIGLVILVIISKLGQIMALVISESSQANATMPLTSGVSLDTEKTASGLVLEKYRMLLRSAYTQDLDGLETLLNPNGSDPVDLPRACQDDEEDDMRSENRGSEGSIQCYDDSLWSGDEDDEDEDDEDEDDNEDDEDDDEDNEDERDQEEAEDEEKDENKGDEEDGEDEAKEVTTEANDDTNPGFPSDDIASPDHFWEFRASLGDHVQESTYVEQNYRGDHQAMAQSEKGLQDDTLDNTIETLRCDGDVENSQSLDGTESLEEEDVNDDNSDGASNYHASEQGSSSRNTEIDRENGEDTTDTDQDGHSSKLDLEDIKTAFVRSACFLAVENGKWRSVETLLKYGISPNLKDFEGRTLLHRATARDDYRLVQLLIDHKADIDRRDINGRTALMANAMVEKTRVLQLLMKHGADINLTQREGCHEIYEAAVFGAAEVVKFYLKNKVNPSITNNFGWTPLHGAAANGHYECVDMLLRHRAIASPVSDTGETPLDFVVLEQSHYDHILTGGTHYAKQIERAKALSAQERATRRDDIHDLLVRAGAKRASELKEKIGEDEFYRRMNAHPSWQDNSWWERSGRPDLWYQHDDLI